MPPADSDSVGTVLQVLDNSDVRYTSGCPAKTDRTYNTDADQAVCVRNASSPHPGDIGKGGGIIQTGDCIFSFSALAIEVPCSRSTYTGRIAARAASDSGCPSKAIEGVKAPDNSSAGSTLCLSNGPGILANGECGPRVVDGRVKLTQVSCSSSAGIRVLGRVASKSDCPSGTDGTISDSKALPARSIVCAQRL